MTSSFTTLSFITSFSRFALLPSILAASLALSACQNNAVPNENGVQEEGANTTTNAADNSDSTSDATIENDTTKVDKPQFGISAQKKDKKRSPKLLK